MKLLFTILFVTLSSFAFAQEGWSWVNPLPQGNNLSDIEVTANLSVAVGYGGTIMTNNGSGWKIRDGGFEDVLFSVCIYGNNIWTTGMGPFCIAVMEAEHPGSHKQAEWINNCVPFFSWTTKKVGQ
jgi:hypothetical protein